MAYITLINLFKTLDEALTVTESPQVEESGLGRYDGIQLLPNNPLPYVQMTQNPDGIELEDWTVEVYSICGELLGDISDYFTCQPFDDDLGIPQIIWSLTNVPTDFGVRLIYLKITQTAGETFYSTPFQLTDYRSSFTIRLDYRNSEFDPMQSVQVKAWYRWTGNADTQNNYEEKSTRTTRSLTVGRQRFAVYFTEFWNNNFWNNVVDILESRYVYLNLVRQTLFETPEIPEPQGDANFMFGEFKLIPIPYETFDPLYVAPVPPIPEPGDDFAITFTAYNRLDEFRAKLAIPTVEGYETIVYGQSYVTINGDPVSLNTVLVNVVDGVINVFTNYTPYIIVGGQVQIGEYNIRVTNGSDLLDYQYSGTPLVIFNASEIASGVSKDIETTIATV